MYSIRTPISTANSVAPAGFHLPPAGALFADVVAAVAVKFLGPVAHSWMTNPT